jgi:hypothetical protein
VRQIKIGGNYSEAMTMKKKPPPCVYPNPIITVITAQIVKAPFGVYLTL